MKLPTFRSLVRWGLIGTSYIFFVLVGLLLVVATAAALLQEAKRRSQDDTIYNLKALYIGLAYVLLAVAALTILITRQREVRQKLASIPNNHVAIRKDDVPKSVHSFITREYLRSAAILSVSQPTNGNHDGWGDLGTEWEGVRLRRRLLDTLSELDAAVHVILPKYQHLGPVSRVTDFLRPIETLIVAQNKRAIASLVEYDSIIEFARHAQREPTMDEFLRGMRAGTELIDLIRSYEQPEEEEVEQEAEQYEGQISDVLLEQTEEEEESGSVHDVPILHPHPMPTRALLPRLVTA